MSPGTRTTPEKTKKSGPEIPEDISHFDVFIKPDYVRASLDEDGENYTVVDYDRNVTTVSAEKFSNEYEAVAPAQVTNTSLLPPVTAPPEEAAEDK